MATASAMATLIITDGTTILDLLNPMGPYMSATWRPAAPGYKGGGTWRSSPLVSGRQLIDRQFDNVLDTFALVGRASTADALITWMQDLRRLLERAADYWTTKWQTTPVWLEAKAHNESNTRYALINAGALAGDPDPYGSPFFDCDPVLAPALTLIVEHQFWQSTIPGTGVDQLLSSVEAFNGTNFGNVTSTGVRQPKSDSDNVLGFSQVFVSNKQVRANFTHIFRADAVPTFDANLLNTAVPYNLFKAMTAGSATYFGVAVAPLAPFDSIVFDLGSDIALTITGGVWEYWSGAAWATLTVQDNLANATPNYFVAPYQNSVNWRKPANWATTTVNGVSGWWVRFRIITASAPLVSPKQNNRNPYTVVWPYVEAQAADVLGDVPAIMEMIVRNTSNPVDVLYPLGFDRLYIGLRSSSRGASFRAYLNFGDVNNQNGAGIASHTLGTHSAVVADAQSASGVNITWTVSAITPFEAAADIIIDDSIAASFKGRYRVFLRANHNTASSQTSVQAKLGIKIAASVELFASAIVTMGSGGGVASTLPYDLFDMGTVEIPVDLIFTDALGDITLKIYLSCSEAVSNIVELFDIVLLPIDEWSAEFVNSDPGGLATIAQFGPYDPNGVEPYVKLDIDSLRNLKRKIRSLGVGMIGPANAIAGYYEPRSVGSAVLQSNAQQRVYFLMGRQRSAAWLSSDPAIGARISIDKSHRYLGMRGSR